MQSSNPGEDVPRLDGPDYVALVIEWNDAEKDQSVTPTGGETSSEPAPRVSTARTIAAVLGALGALFVAAWGLRRLRAV
ncbi:MAG TPA: hypothetical protein VF469_19090 [Kofleriaceae bacterium]